MNETYLTPSEIKRQLRQARKARNKLARKVATMRKQREETFKLIDEIKKLHDEQHEIASVLYTPPRTYDY